MPLTQSPPMAASYVTIVQYQPESRYWYYVCIVPCHFIACVVLWNHHRKAVPHATLYSHTHPLPLLLHSP